MQFIIATTKSGVYRLQVFNRGFQIATHNSASRKYVNRRIKGYIARTASQPQPCRAWSSHKCHLGIKLQSNQKNIMSQPKEFSDLFDFRFNETKGFTLASRMLDIRNQAERIANQANDKQIANGEFATMFAENIKDWMNDIANVADSALDLHLADNAKKQEG